MWLCFYAAMYFYKNQLFFAFSPTKEMITFATEN
jgi:hypothetical protein